MILLFGWISHFEKALELCTRVEHCKQNPRIQLDSVYLHFPLDGRVKHRKVLKSSEKTIVSCNNNNNKFKASARISLNLSLKFIHVYECSIFTFATQKTEWVREKKRATIALHQVISDPWAEWPWNSTINLPWQHFIYI